MDGDSNAFLSQILEIDRAVDTLSRVGKLHQNKISNLSNHQQAHSLGTSRYPNTSHYASQRQPFVGSHRNYNSGRGANGLTQNGQAQTQHANLYYSSPPPLQQQYTFNQQQNAYSGMLANPIPFNGPTGFERQNTELPHESGTQYSPMSVSRPAVPSQSQSQVAAQYAPRSHSPFGGSGTLPPLSRLNTGGAASSGHSTTPSLSGGMSSSTSMLPPGYGRDSFVSTTPSIAHSRAHSITGHLAQLSGQNHEVHHTRNASANQGHDQARTLAGLHMSSGTSGIFSPPLDHSRTASISAGSPGTQSPASTAFNFYSGPSAQSNGAQTPVSSTVMNLSGNGHHQGSSRIAPIGRPVQAKSTSDSFASSRMAFRNSNGTTHSSGVTSGVTSPLSNGFADGWLDDTAPPSTSGPLHSKTGGSEAKRKSLQSVWNN